MALAGRSPFVQRVAAIRVSIVAMTGLLEDVAGLLRRLVLVVGWVVVLWGLVRLFSHQVFSLERLVTPGAGALAVLQGLVRPRLRKANGAAVAGGEPILRAESPGNMGDVLAECIPEPEGSEADASVGSTLGSAPGLSASDQAFRCTSEIHNNLNSELT